MEATQAPAPTTSSATTPRRWTARTWPWLVAAVLAVGVAAALVALRAAPPLPGVSRQPPLDVQGLQLVDYDDTDEGDIVDLVPPRGEVTLAYLGYMNCPDVCPTTLADIRVALQQLGPDRAADVTVAFITVDPERDAGPEIRDYLQLFYPDLPNGTAALRADGPTSLEAVAERLNVYYEVAPHDEGAQRYDVGHSAVTYVVDDTGTVVRELPFGASPEDVARVIGHVLATS